MAIPVALIGAVIAAGSAIYSAIATGQKNKKDRYAAQYSNMFNTILENQRYERQLKDQRKNWKMENQYNSPQNTMNLYRQAGLNPHLIYGKGADATASSLGGAPSYSNLGRKEISFGPPPDINPISNSLMQYYDIKAKQAQIDNVNQSTALMQQESLFKQANTAKTVQDTARGKFDLGQAQELKDSVIQQAKLQNEKTRADTIYTVDENQRKALASSQDLKYTAEKILTEKIAHAKDYSQIELLKEQINAVRQDQHIKTYEEDLTRMGIYKSDPWYFRGLMNLMNGNMSVPEGVNPLIDRMRRNNPFIDKSKRHSSTGSSW